MEHEKHAALKKKTEPRTSPGEMSGMETGATGNFWEAVPVPQGTYQGGPRGYHRVHAVDWPASGQRQCIAGEATQQQQQRQHMHSVPWASSAIDVSTYEGCVFTCAAVWNSQPDSVKDTELCRYLNTFPFSYY